MKTASFRLILVPVLLASVGWVLAGQTKAQTITNLHNFSALDPATQTTNNDGANPYAGLVLSGNILYGTAQYGGTNGSGTVFKVGTNGMGFATLHAFTGLDPNTGTNTDGANPMCGLILSGNILYGTASAGGNSDNGTVFKVNNDGTGFTNIYDFTGGEDGGYPEAGLILSGGILYGTAYYGGSNGVGSVFAVNANGAGFTNVYSFSAGDNSSSGYYTNSDGAYPQAGLILSGSILYGTAYEGGTNGNGTMFKVKTNGTGFSILHAFTGLDPNTGTNSDGANPTAGLILSGNTLYGTAEYGGTDGSGTVFMVSTNGAGFVTLHAFTGGSDGANPQAGLVLSAGIVYGTEPYGGSSFDGTVFDVNTNGTGFTTLYSFTGGGDGANPTAGLVLSGGTLYGTAQYGGTNGNGTVFSVSTNYVANNNDQIFGFVSDGNGDPIVGVKVYANDGIGGIFTNTTDYTGYYSFTIADGNWDVSVDCNQLTAMSYPCVVDKSVFICCGNAIEADFIACNQSLQITTTSLPVGNLTIPYDQFLQASSCNTSFTWSLNSGILPTGLQLDSFGELFGNPTSGGTFNFSVHVTDGNGNSTNQSLSLAINSPTPVLSTPTILNNGQFQMAIKGNAGNFYTIQFSTNLINWVPLLITNPPDAQPMYVKFPTTNKAGFYRAYQSGIAVSQSIFSLGTSAFGMPVFYVNVTNGVAVIPITRANGLSNSACVNYYASDGTAVSHLDYTPASGTLCFGAEVSSNSFSIPVYLLHSTNQSATVNLHLSDTNGNNVLSALLVIQRPAPILAVFPNNPYVLVTPLNDPCSPAVLTISNAGPSGSYLNYQLSFLNSSQTNFITINGNNSSLGASGFLLSGQSVSESFYAAAKYYYLQQPTNPAAFANMTIPLNIHTPDTAGTTDFQVNLGVTNTFSLLLGTWGGSFSAGHVSGLWTLDIVQAYAVDSGELKTIGVVTYQATLPYYNTNKVLTGICCEFQGVTVSTDIYACGNILVVGAGLSIMAPPDSGVKEWILGGTIPLNLITGAVVQGNIPFPGNRCYADLYYDTFNGDPGNGNLGGTGTFFGSRQNP